ncbi:hypothetical protein DPMN_126718 [Dreissena polymorpha]|uniref:Uncharacterized protein n=1 Tax=Dreissena polymorpha TaxID=45954 RepID=A0A9D4H0N0_DREPO|nr:hypothetical protein DPMN_126718 [Dreissena polymorpha]
MPYLAIFGPESVVTCFMLLTPGCDPQEPGPLKETPCTLVNSPEQLETLVNMLKKQTEIAVDLEVSWG